MPQFDINLNMETLQTWAIAVLAALLAYLVFRLILLVLRRQLQAQAKRRKTELNGFGLYLVRDTRTLFLLVVSLYIGSFWVNLSPEAARFIRTVFVVTALIQSGFWISHLVSFVIERRVNRVIEEDAGSATTLNAVKIVAKGTVWAIILLMVLDNIPGIEVTTLIASLGITGIAIGLAVQNILGDLFASLSIALDKPFVIGDFIIVGEHMGTVEHIGLKSSRIRSLTGEQLIFGNADLLSSRIRNMKRMQRRRGLMRFGVTYQTPPEKLEAIPGVVQEIIERFADLTFERAHFKEYSAFALNFEVVFWLEDRDFSLFMDRQQAINLELYRRFQQHGIEFAYPTQTVFLAPTQSALERPNGQPDVK